MTVGEDARLEMPVDQYQRYRVAADLAAGLGVGGGARVLEVGGGPGPLEAFFPDNETLVSDIEGTHAGRFLVADGAALPFGDESMDVVVTLDSLEHVPVARRESFLRELRRVTADVVLLCAPFDSADVRTAESAVREFVSVRFGAGLETMRWLGEHLEHGLPDLAATVESFATAGWAVATLPSGYLPRWLGVMLVDHELLATGVGHLGKLHAFYNATMSPSDCREPSYRHFIVASRGRPESELGTTVGRIASSEDSTTGRTALAALASFVFSQRLDAVVRTDASHRALDDEARVSRDLERVVADRDARIGELVRFLDQVRIERDHAVLAERQAVSRSRMLGIPYGLRRLSAHLAKKESDR